MPKQRIAVITGADRGFGKEFVQLLVRRKDIAEIWAIARDEDKLNQLSKEYGAKIRVFPMDLTERANYEGLQKRLAAGNVCVRFLINNAGFAKFCAYDDISIEESLNMVDLNINAVVALGLVCIPYMAAGSHIVNVASQASFFPLPYLNLYSATKAFVRNYTRALNVELRERGITATAVCPGWMKTELYRRAMIGAKKGANVFAGMAAPGAVAKKALSDAIKGRDMSVYGVYVKSTHVMSKLLPQRVMMKLWLEQQNIK